MIFLRLDVDHACFNKLLSYLHLTSGMPIPNFLDHEKATQNFLKDYPDVQRYWMFRPQTCPNSWDEYFGLHTRGFYYFPKEYEQLTKKLGSFKYFSRHGFAPYVSGTLWTMPMIQTIEKKFNVIDLSSKFHVSIDLTPPSQLDHINFSRLHHINFHPCHLYTHGKILGQVLEKIK